MTERMVSTQLADVKLDLALSEVIERLPTPSLPVTDAALADYLDALYVLGRLRHTPNISPANVAWLTTLVQQHRPQRILEIGCANGYSTLRLWQMTRAWGARIVTMDISRPSYTEAVHHLTHLGATAAVDAHFGNALQILPALQTTHNEGFDLIFIDAQKAHTLDFFVRARRLAAPNALIVVDDVLKFADKMRNFYDYLTQQHIAYDIIELADDDDGVMLIALAPSKL